MFLLFIFISVRVFFVNSLYLPQVPKVANDTAEEIQHAICKITSKELEATANATITRQLKGVCTSSYMQEKLDELQTNILREIEGIKYILKTNGFVVTETKTENVTDNRDNIMIKSLSFNNYSRSGEIQNYNDTVIDSNAGNVYYYYWDVHHIRKLLERRDMYKSSPDFFVLGHTLHLQFYPNHLENHFGILLRPSSSGFLKKHKIYILNQFRESSDISSVILNGLRVEDSIFVISEDLISKNGFIKDDVMIIKLELFLNS
ncbi:hypothetical protein JTB14_019567 [Gonioctena quinquepunctata]|nr:hypothetical protein JTB14_019567 [Gonioctena quinquepunctata]